VGTDTLLAGQEFYFPKTDESPQKCGTAIHQQKCVNCCGLKGEGEREKKKKEEKTRQFLV